MGPQDILAALLWGASLLGIGLGGYGVIRYGYALARHRHPGRRYSRAALREPRH
ncbi:hypothetical protein QMO56_26015 [Roseomonas sp. E05]|uniref:hypothetical protein n=1 Tax=Roseomonas sp. E05 TaxID=3046310 RepID=UPI0024B93CCE|nr:hypothetical protein [Roseomonas sp. E05]MDJ0391564.1 hypothetical protein [Roseomonas sp. E05]